MDSDRPASGPKPGNLTRRLRLGTALTLVFLLGLAAVFLTLWLIMIQREQAVRAGLEGQAAAWRLHLLLQVAVHAGPAGTGGGSAPLFPPAGLAQAIAEDLARITATGDPDAPRSRLARIVRRSGRAPWPQPLRQEALDLAEQLGRQQDRRVAALVRDADAMQDWMMLGGVSLALVKLIVLGGVLASAMRLATREERLLAERTALLREVNHRVGNSLAMATALLLLQEEATAEPAQRRAVRRARLRIGALGQVHRSLLKVQTVDRLDLGPMLDEFAQTLSGVLEARQRILVTAQGPLIVTVDAAVALAVAVGELVANAIQHSCAGQPDCRVEVVVEDGTDQLYVIIRTRGGVSADPRPAPADADRSPRPGVGLTIVQALLSQLGGTLSRQQAGTISETCLRVDWARVRP